MAITWQNIPTTREASMVEAASVPYATLGKTFKDSIQGLVDVIDGYQEKKTDLNTQHYLDQLDAYTDPKKLQEARQNGAIEALRNSYGRYFDRKATRGSDEARLNSLQEVEKGHQQYTDMITRAAQRGLVNQAQQMIMNGVSADKVNDFINKNNLLESEDLRKFQMDWAKHTSGLALDKARIAYSNFQLNEVMAKARRDTERNNMLRDFYRLGADAAQNQDYVNTKLSKFVENNPEFRGILKQDSEGNFNLKDSVIALGERTTKAPLKEYTPTKDEISRWSKMAQDEAERRLPKSKYDPIMYKSRVGLPAPREKEISPQQELAIREQAKENIFNSMRQLRLNEENTKIEAERQPAIAALAALNKFAGEHNLYEHAQSPSEAVRERKNAYYEQGYTPEDIEAVFNPSRISPFKLELYGTEYENKVESDKQVSFFNNKALNNTTIGVMNKMNILEQDKVFEDVAKYHYPDDEKHLAMAEGAKAIRTKGVKINGSTFTPPPGLILDVMRSLSIGVTNRDDPEYYADRIADEIRKLAEKDPSFLQNTEGLVKAADYAEMESWGKKK